MGDEFKNEVFSSFEPNPVPGCKYCDRSPHWFGPCSIPAMVARSVCSSASAGSKPGSRKRSEAAWCWAYINAQWPNLNFGILHGVWPRLSHTVASDEKFRVRINRQTVKQ